LAHIIIGIILPEAGSYTMQNSYCGKMLTVGHPLLPLVSSIFCIWGCVVCDVLDLQASPAVDRWTVSRTSCFVTGGNSCHRQLSW